MSRPNGPDWFDCADFINLKYILSTRALLFLWIYLHAKKGNFSFKLDQLISKRLSGLFNSSKKWMKNLCPSRLRQKFKKSSLFFGRKFPFEINWPFITKIMKFPVLIGSYFWHVLKDLVCFIALVFRTGLIDWVHSTVV